MSRRDPALQAFLTGLADGFAASGCVPDVSAVVAKLSAALALPAEPGPAQSRRLPVCRHLPAALDFATSSTPAVATLASAFARLEPSLSWAPRPSGGPFASANWPDGHANAMIVGPYGSSEQRDDVAIGVSLLAPAVRYPDHNHPPEEVYLLLTPGRFRHGDDEWCEPGPGGTFHNAPHIVHAMASTALPLVAFWCLLLR